MLQYLKLDGKLKGQEIEVGGNHYMRGDRWSYFGKAYEGSVG